MSIYQFKYVSDFQCDGARCNAKCCKNNWLILIDEKTYQKYQRVKDKSVRNKILDSMTKAEDGKGYVIALNEKRECPLICKDTLCFVQRNLGPEALSVTCQTYPRNLLWLGDCQLRSLSMTCPVAAEGALFSDDAMEIMLHEVGQEHNNGWKLLLQNEKKKKNIDGVIAESVILGGISILQNKNFTRAERMILLGLFWDKADDLKVLPNAAEEIVKLAAAYQSESFEASARELLSSFVFPAEENKKFMHDLLFGMAEKGQIGALNNLLKQAEDYEADYARWSEELEAKFGSAIDNYWINEIFYHGYPFALDGSFLHNYFVYLLSYKVWEIVLYGYVHLLKRMMTKEEFIKLAGTYSKIMDHRKKFLPVIEEKAVECEA